MLMYLLEESSKNRALDHGLEFTLENAVGCENPRDEESSTLVGVDVEFPAHIDLSGSFKELVANYCSQVLDCAIDDIVWTGVVKTEHSGVAYSTEMPTGDWSSHYEGFIYLKNNAIQDEYSVEKINQELKDKILMRFSDEMQEYTAWCLDDGYDIEVASVDKKYKDYASCVLNVNNSVDRVFNEIVSGLLAHIKQDGKSVDIKVGFDKSSVPSYISAVHLFNKNINNVFKTVLTLSDFKIDNDAGVFEAKVSLNALASFLKLASNVSESLDINLFELVKLAVDAIIDNEKSEPLDEMQVINTLTSNAPYKDWSPLILKALMTVIVSQVPFVELIDVSE